MTPTHVACTVTSGQRGAVVEHLRKTPNMARGVLDVGLI